MKISTKFNIVLLFCIVNIIGVFSLKVKAQDPVLSQFYTAPMLLNPAFAGTTSSPRVALNYRNQWASILSAYSTYSISLDQYFEPIKSGIGFAIMMDEAGDGIYKSGQFNVTYSYRFPITNDIFVKGGIQAGLYQTSLDWDRLVFLDQINPLNGEATTLTAENRPEQLSRSAFDISAGLLVFSEMFYGGFSMFHLSSPSYNYLSVDNQLEEGLPVRVSFHGGAQFSLNPNNIRGYNTFISPNVMYTRQQNFHQVNGGVYAGWGPVFGGMWYRHTFSNQDALITMVGANYNIFKLGYSYDFTVSKLMSESNGAHEISLSLNFDVVRDRSVDYNDCFNLFR